MAIDLNHTIVPAADAEKSARWLAELLGLGEPKHLFGYFWQVQTDNGVELDFESRGEGEGAPLFTVVHYAFLVSEAEFDEIFGRILDRHITHWADPSRKHAGAINHDDGGRGVYFASNDDHLLEIITRPYGSGTLGEA